jgi:hypothetical protein
VPPKKPKQTEAEQRLERAITYWIEHEPLATIEEIKRVAKKFGAHWRSLAEAIKMRREMEK